MVSVSVNSRLFELLGSVSLCGLFGSVHHGLRPMTVKPRQIHLNLPWWIPGKSFIPTWKVTLVSTSKKMSLFLLRGGPQSIV